MANGTAQLMENLRLESKIKKLEGNAKDAKKVDDADQTTEIDNLRKELEQKERDLETLKKQCEGLSREYNELSDKYAATQKQDFTPKKNK